MIGADFDTVIPIKEDGKPEYDWEEKLYKTIIGNTYKIRVSCCIRIYNVKSILRYKTIPNWV